MRQHKLAATLFSVSAGFDWIHKTMSQVNATHYDSADCRRRVGPLRLICLKGHCAVARWHSRKILCKPVTRAIQFLACSQHQKPHSTACLASWLRIVWSAGMVRHFEIMFHRFSQTSTLFPHFWWAVYLAIQVYAFLLPVGRKKSHRDTYSQPQKCRPRGHSNEIFRTFIPSQLFDIWCKELRCFCGPSLAARSSSQQTGLGHLPRGTPTGWWWCLRRAKWKDAPFTKTNYNQ